ncbi:MAG: SPFH domain-containing protein, partial [Clostridia bacterium]
MGKFWDAVNGQLLKVIEWEDEDKNLLVYKFPMENKEIMMDSKLIVRESQVAVFVNNGKIADVFTPGIYKLSADNLPILTVLMSWIYAFNSPFKAEVYFVNTKQFTAQKWGTQNPIMLRDKEFGVVRLRGYGVYSFRANDATKLLKELFGTNSTFTIEDITEQLKSNVVAGLTDLIASSKISAIDLATNYNEFSVLGKTELQEKFKEFGLELCSLVIENLSLPAEVEKVLDERTKLGVFGDQMGKIAMRSSANDLKEESKPKENKSENKTNCIKCGVEIKATV